MENFVIFVVSCKHVDNFNFHSGLTSSRSDVNGAYNKCLPVELN